MSNKKEYTIFGIKKLKNMISWVLRSKMSVSWEKVRPVGQFEILAQDNLFLSKVRLVGQFFFEILSYWTDSSVGVLLIY